MEILIRHPGIINMVRTVDSTCGVH